MPTAAGHKTYAELKATKPVRWWHEAIIDDMIAFPMDNLEKRSQRLNYSPSYLSIIMNTDMFRAAWEARRRQHSELVSLGISTKVGAVAAKSLDIMLETLESKRGAIPFSSLSKTTEVALAALGYGSKAPAVAVNVDARQQNNTVNVSVTPEQLAEARAALQRAESARALEPPTQKVESGSDEPVLDLVPNPE